MSVLETRLRQKVDDLPVLPSVIAGLMALDRSDDHYFEDVLELVESDPTFAARIMAVSNSAASAPRHEVASVRAALARLGATTTSDLVLAAAISRVFVPSSDWERSLWRHNLQVAAGMRAMAPLVRGAVDPDTAHAAGLLHDIGRLVFFSEAPEALQRIDEGQWSTPQELVDYERSVCGIDHAEVGRLACERWGLPATLAEVVGRHHDEATGPDLVGALIGLLRFVDYALFPSATPGAEGWESADLAAIEEHLLPRARLTLDIGAKDLRALIAGVVVEAEQQCERLGLS